MKRRGLVFVLIAFALVIAVNAFTYTSLLNGSNTMLNLLRKLNIAYVTPQSYMNLAKKLQKKPMDSVQQIDKIISNKSTQFIAAAFNKDRATLDLLLDKSTKYIMSADGSSFIRYIEDDVHVEGYMATDKRLIKSNQRWHVSETDKTVTCSMEVYIEGSSAPQLWYLHFRKADNDWKLFMLENDV